MLKNLLLSFSLLISFFAQANVVVYKAGTKIITGTWFGTNSLAEISTNSPYEGSEHYKFTYNYTNWWAGFGLNLNNWGSSPSVNFTGNTHLRLAFRGLDNSKKLTIRLKNGTINGNTVEIGGANTAYQVVTIPMFSLISGTSLSLNAISELEFAITNEISGNGSVYIDAIEALSLSAPVGGATATAWARGNALKKGFNTANWLEAYWLLPFNTYPVANDFTRAKFSALKDAGFNFVRLPVIFERLGSQTAPYTLNTNQTAFYLVDSAITWANAFNFKLIIDNHHGPDVNDNNFASNTPRICAVWKQLVQRYGNLDPNRFYFELYNEPNNISNANFRTIAQTAMDTIRKYNTTHTFIIGGNGWNSGSGLASFEPITDQNVIYTFHNYDPYYFTHQGFSWTSPANFPVRAFPIGNDVADMRSNFVNVKSWSNYHNFPVLMGEFGVSASADATSRCNWMDKMTHYADSLNFPYAYWDVKNYSDAFGFYPNSIITAANAIPCFKTAMGLYAAPLAIREITQLEAICSDKNILIRWSVEVYDRPGFFAIEASNDGVNWSERTKLKANTNQNRYQTSINLLKKQAYYRVVYFNEDGSKEYSPIITSACVENQSFAIYPNPTQGDDIVLSLNSNQNQDAKVKISNSNGQIVLQADKNIFEGENKIDISLSGFSAGIYYVQMTTEFGNQITMKLIKQ
jgi:endoglucanase